LHVDGASRLRLDEAADFLVTFDRTADDRALRDAGKGADRGLDFGRVHIESAANDHLLDAPDDREVALRAELTDVAGVQPAFGIDRRARLRRVAEIALHDIRAPEANLAARPCR